MDNESTVDKLYRVLIPSELASGKLLCMNSAITVLSVMQSVMSKIVNTSMQSMQDADDSSAAAYQAYTLVWERAKAMVNY